MEEHGVVGFEPGGGDLAKRVETIKKALSGRNIQVSAICAGFKGFILSTDPAIRKQCMDTMKEIIAAAGELGSTGVIIVPAFNSQVPVLPHTMETRDFLCEQFNEMGTYAAQHGTTVIFEPLKPQGVLLPASGSGCRFALPRHQQSGCTLHGRLLAHDLGRDFRYGRLYLRRQIPATCACGQP